MKATIVSTDQVVDIDPKLQKARVWEGITVGGVPFTAYITVVQVAAGADNSIFERELTELKPAECKTRRAINMRLVL